MTVFWSIGIIPAKFPMTFLLPNLMDIFQFLPYSGSLCKDCYCLLFHEILYSLSFHDNSFFLFFKNCFRYSVFSIASLNLVSIFFLLTFEIIRLRWDYKSNFSWTLKKKIISIHIDLFNPHNNSKIKGLRLPEAHCSRSPSY